jgi:glycosyltransferase involved in cell wall biosynthesis
MISVRYTTTLFPTEVFPRNKSYILWLASWYPTKTIPYNGDFIQRHALATSLYHQVVVIHVIHDPSAETDVYYDISIRENLTEIIVYFRDPGPGSGLTEKIRYNLHYFRKAKNFIHQLFDVYPPPLFVHVHVPMKKGKIALWIKQRWNLPYLVSEHDASYLKSAPDNYFSRNAYYRYNVNRIFANALAVTNVSQAVGNILLQEFSPRHFFIVRNAVDDGIFTYTQKNPAAFRFIHVSTMNYQKNIEGILSAFEKIAFQFKAVELMLTGPIPPEAIKAVTSNKAVTRILTTGEVPYKQVARLMQEADCFVMFSRYENFPCVIIEALSCGLPVITSDVGGAGEAIQQDNGIVVSSENENELVAAMKKMIENVGFYRHAHISREAHEQYGYTTIGRKFMDTYRTLKLL